MKHIYRVHKFELRTFNGNPRIWGCEWIFQLYIYIRRVDVMIIHSVWIFGISLIFEGGMKFWFAILQWFFDTFFRINRALDRFFYAPFISNFLLGRCSKIDSYFAIGVRFLFQICLYSRFKVLSKTSNTFNNYFLCV